MATDVKLLKIEDFSVCLNLHLKDRLFLPVCPAIYFVYTPPADVIYIGRSDALKYRWSRKRALRYLIFHPDMRIAWFPLPKKFHPKIERELITLYRPLDNYTPFHVKFP